MKKSSLKSLLIISLVLTLVILGTWAYFEDTVTSRGNTFTARPTPDLKLSDDDEGFGDGVSATWVMDNMLPGSSSVLNQISLQNSGHLRVDHLEISFSHALDEAANPIESDTNPNSLPGELARWIEITLMSYGRVNFLRPPPGGLTDANGNGWVDLEDVTLPPNSNEGGPLDNLPPPRPNNGGTRTLTMELFFRSEATNDIQGDILTTTVTFTLNQDASQ